MKDYKYLTEAIQDSWIKEVRKVYTEEEVTDTTASILASHFYYRMHGKIPNQHGKMSFLY